MFKIFKKKVRVDAEPKYTWDDISISDYYDILDIAKEFRGDSIDSNLDVYVSLLSIFSKREEDEFYNMSLTELADEIKKLDLQGLKPRTPKFEYVIDGKRYELTPNVNSMTAGQYIDFQTYLAGDDEKKIAQFISVFLIPKGKKYADGYDVEKLIEHLFYHFPIVEAISINSFFQIVFNGLTKAYLSSKLKTVMKKEKNKEKRMEMEKVIREHLNKLGWDG